MQKNILAVAAFSAALAVILGAIGAHALKESLPPHSLESFNTAVRYQAWHSIALLFLALASQKLKGITTVAWLWGLGILLMAPLTLVTLGKLDEVAEVTLGPAPKRLWQPPADDENDAERRFPKVSIQIPAYRENPDMLIETLNSTAALDYPNFEVVVIVNNTAEESLWKPVEAHCAKSWPTPNAPMIDGIDTLTMVDDNTMVIEPNMPQAVTHQR